MRGLHGAALLATRTEPAGLATERQKVFQFALGAPNAGESAVQVAAAEEFFQSFTDHRPQRAEPGVVAPVILPEKRLAMVADAPPKR
jgi:hypothetical protein